MSTSGAYDEIAAYFEGLVSQFTTKILNDDFTVIFQQYLLDNNVDMITSGSGGNSYDLSSSKSTIQPDYFGPYLLTRLPTTSPVSEPLSSSNGSANNQIWSKLAVILGTTFGILCICCIICIYVRTYDVCMWCIICMYVHLYVCVCMYVCLHVYICYTSVF